MRRIVLARLIAEAAGLVLFAWLWLNDEPWAALRALYARLAGGI